MRVVCHSLPAGVLEEFYSVEGVKPMALVISNTNYKVNHLRSLKGFRPWERADDVAAAFEV